jgi:hypothetical protein
MTSLKNSEIRAYREAQLWRQDYVCPLCEKTIELDQAALDHCHRTGSVRMVVHRWCNSVLGRIENWSKRVGGINNLQLLRNILVYLEKDTTGIMHPMHNRKRRKKPAVKRRRVSR